jgi:hypothetical protein
VKRKGKILHQLQNHCLALKKRTSIYLQFCVLVWTTTIKITETKLIQVSIFGCGHPKFWWSWILCLGFPWVICYDFGRPITNKYLLFNNLEARNMQIQLSLRRYNLGSIVYWLCVTLKKKQLLNPSRISILQSKFNWFGNRGHNTESPTYICSRIITMFIEDSIILNWHKYSGSEVGWGTMLQAGRSRVRVPMRWIFFKWPNPSSRTMALGPTQPLTEMSQESFWGVKGGRRVRLTI